MRALGAKIFRGRVLVFTVIGLLPLSMGLANFSLRASAVAAVMAPVMIVAGLYCDEMGVAVWVGLLGHVDCGRIPSESGTPGGNLEGISNTLAASGFVCWR